MAQREKIGEAALRTETNDYYMPASKDDDQPDPAPTDFVPFWRERHDLDFVIPRWQPFAAKHAELEEKAAKYYEAHDARCQSVQDEADALANDVLKPLRET